MCFSMVDMHVVDCRQVRGISFIINGTVHESARFFIFPDEQRAPVKPPWPPVCEIVMCSALSGQRCSSSERVIKLQLPIVLLGNTIKGAGEVQACGGPWRRDIGTTQGKLAECEPNLKG